MIQVEGPPAMWNARPVNTMSARLGLRAVVLLLAVCSAVAAPAAEAPLRELADAWRVELLTRTLPYWHDTAQDETNDGYLLADDLKGRGQAREKQLVSQARMIWTFSLAHRLGWSTDQRNYYQAATRGYRFLRSRLFDTRHGGYYWKTDLEGKPINDGKYLYGQAFVVYALVEYYRAGGDREALQRAVDLYNAIQVRLHDARHKGWFEHVARDWQPLAPGDPRAEVEVIGYKSANAHLHWMEALTELYDATRDPGIKKSLAEALKLNARYFYPPAPGQSAFHRHPDWKPVSDPKSAGLSYGHNVEFAWLMIRAEETLGRRPSWKHFYAHLNHALAHGYDHARGGLYNRGLGDQPAHDTSKVWWVQAEMLAALTDALRNKPNPAYEDALRKLLAFVQQHQTDPKDGIWLDTVSADGEPRSTAKAHSWKANYHDVRALAKFVQAFSAPAPPSAR